MSENRGLEVPELRTRLGHQILVQRRARPVVRREGIGLPTGAVQGEHQLGPEPLAVWEFGDEPLELIDQLTRAPELELSLDLRFERVSTKLIEANRFGMERSLIGQIAEGTAMQERERSADRLRGSSISPPLKGSEALTGQPLEAVSVDPIGLEVEL
jgi:hypothetical protein